MEYRVNDIKYVPTEADNTDGFGGKIRVLAQPLPRCRSNVEMEGAAGRDLGLILHSTIYNTPFSDH